MNANRKSKPQVPLVSVIMPVYNAAAFVAEAIESILVQTYKNFELIIIDDASTDQTWKIIRHYKKRHKDKIKAMRLRTNLSRGGDAAGNVGMTLAKGDFIARMDADDIAFPYRLERQVRYLQTHPECAVLGSSAHIINREGEVVGEKRVATSHNEIYKEYFVLHPMIHPTVMIRRSALLDPNTLYMMVLSSNNDYLTFFKMIASGKKFANLNDKLIYYRIHGSNDSLAQVKRSFINSIRIRYRAVFEFGYRPTSLSLVKLAAQTVLVLALPEKLIFHLYLLVRGIAKPADYVRFIKLPRFTRLKKAFKFRLATRLKQSA